jgi:hypothetical protein
MEQLGGRFTQALIFVPFSLRKKKKKKYFFWFNYLSVLNVYNRLLTIVYMAGSSFALGRGG